MKHYTISDQSIQDILQTVSDQLEDLDTIKALIGASLDDFTKRQTVKGGELTHAQQLRAVARYSYLLGYGLGMEDTLAALAEATQHD